MAKVVGGSRFVEIRVAVQIEKAKRLHKIASSIFITFHSTGGSGSGVLLLIQSAGTGECSIGEFDGSFTLREEKLFPYPVLFHQDHYFA